MSHMMNEMEDQFNVDDDGFDFISWTVEHEVTLDTHECEDMPSQQAHICAESYVPSYATKSRPFVQLVDLWSCERAR